MSFVFDGMSRADSQPQTIPPCGEHAAAYWRYWGKASRQNSNTALWHLLPYHALDVAAVMRHLLTQASDWVEAQAAQLGWNAELLIDHLVFFAALHDLGKFSRSFQQLYAHHSPDLVDCHRASPYTLRHDSLGYLLWCDHLQNALPPDLIPDLKYRLWKEWMQVVCGHHGQPPEEGAHSVLRASTYFLAEDQEAAEAFCRDAFALLLPKGLQAPAGKPTAHSKNFSWPFAGLMVLADWIGSNQDHFPYCSRPTRTLSNYWHEVAVPNACQAVQKSGLQLCAVAPYLGPDRLLYLFDYLAAPTPLQHYAATVELVAGPQLFLLEDVTGAGKTEAALILAHRLMAAGLAQGLYFALPTMATSNQMYRRVGAVYRKLYAPSAQPSIVLAHSARRLVEDFQHALNRPDGAYVQHENTATMSCNAWLADSNKKALLASVGVGSIDQALLAVLPVRHQSLRIAGLKDKVLVVDEIHSFDPYVHRLLCRLLRTHAEQGGSVILLSATVPAVVKADLLNAYSQGLGRSPKVVLEPQMDYPLITQFSQESLVVTPCETRAEVKRTVQVVLLHEEAQVIARIVKEAAAGRCVCWVRNTVDDARQAYTALQSVIPLDRLHLFHSRFAMGHRLEIENMVLDALGKNSNAEMRHGRVLIGTQVLEQSLDFDVDVMICDLAPIDLVIQRSGRLQRHTRDSDGNRTHDGTEHRPPPVLYLYGPEPTSTPAADWYGQVFRGGQYVYLDIAKLWLTQQALLAAGCIVSPGEIGQAGAVRQLVEAVYGESVPVPEALQKNSEKCLGEATGKVNIADYNSLNLSKGYCRDSSRCWDEEINVPTRLGDETRTVYLAQVTAGKLRPLYFSEGVDAHQQWALSALRVPAARLHALSPDFQHRFGAALHALRAEQVWLSEYDLVLPLMESEHVKTWLAEGCDANGQVVMVKYSPILGLRVE